MGSVLVSFKKAPPWGVLEHINFRDYFNSIPVSCSWDVATPLLSCENFSKETWRSGRKILGESNRRCRNSKPGWVGSLLAHDVLTSVLTPFYPDFEQMLVFDVMSIDFAYRGAF